MKKTILLLTMLFVSLSSKATLLTIDLNQDSYQVGDTLTADFIFTDIEDDSLGFQKLLASFEFSFAWSNDLIEYSSTSFGNLLDVDPSFASFQTIDTETNSLTINELSFAQSIDLFTAQDGLSSFVLASINFNVLSNGEGEFILSNILFGDAFGNNFTNIANDIDDNYKPYVITATKPVDVPEPASILLLLMALMLIMKQRKVN
ncbi:PEP-CTERM sorting domain-containing protein [Colwellia sp. 4_MG-2023]|jgi:hypothetical protein|uniref:PEP-CTERM sorting domain-containing protein n=1 Tax=unclassified Colwellia TaxID=196834 RepID=UPI001C087C3F|nr:MULTISPECIES: PEP-CTERM sorting domain-containing protein [unclassified Colwellia]MBU2924521.1 PEP-CTERM sorting domain-containing protein [Colwellia sp. C2M11]MDO6507339.1 PEP-CTERM sorting domain-containing protein [Colwellia sp. 5_MG-2023]MDO6556072.1 PEP-CTERM sorting domain-containing protein [Colwellia sp. 4_MG-2023]MDO6652932.1 PEP-CTERM sorting domain-containing protein [Colwellia sp. 3_MG-2023]MDO6665414.1 PEP-CTERM sorting domain-containing protein [Colwellia sp. 2_MG-2023]